MAAAAADAECMKLHERVRKHFGEASAEELEGLVLMKRHELAPAVGTTPNYHKSSPTFVEVLPQGAVFLLAGVLQHAGSLPPHLSSDAERLRANVRAAARALTSLNVNNWTAAATSAFGQRLLQVPEAELKLLAAPGGHDYAALRFLGEVVSKGMGAPEVARALQEGEEGRRCLETFRTSPTLGAVVVYASFFWDDIGDWIDGALDWLKGAAQWVKDAVDEFGEWASKQAKAVVDSVFSQFPNATKILEAIPFVGLAVAGIYALAGKSDQALAALAINVNAIVTLIGAGVGFLLGGPAGGMAGGALGKAAGLLIQEAIAKAIDDPELRSEVGDISAARFIAEVALGAVYGGAAGVGEVLGSAAGMGAVGVFASSVGLAALLSRLPGYFTH